MIQYVGDGILNVNEKRSKDTQVRNTSKYTNVWYGRHIEND